MGQQRHASSGRNIAADFCMRVSNLVVGGYCNTSVALFSLTHFETPPLSWLCETVKGLFIIEELAHRARLH